MGKYYNIHSPGDDDYYYCPHDDCPCNDSPTHDYHVNNDNGSADDDDGSTNN